MFGQVSESRYILNCHLFKCKHCTYPLEFPSSTVNVLSNDYIINITHAYECDKDHNTCAHPAN